VLPQCFPLTAGILNFQDSLLSSFFSSQNTDRKPRGCFRIKSKLPRFKKRESDRHRRDQEKCLCCCFVQLSLCWANALMCCRAPREAVQKRERGTAGTISGSGTSATGRTACQVGTVTAIAPNGSPGVPEYCAWNVEERCDDGLSSVLSELKQMSLVQRDKIVGLAGEAPSYSGVQ
jgi:hypothetical protein